MITTFAPSTPMDDLTAALDRDGVIIIERLFDDDALDAVWAEIGPHLEDAIPAGGEFLGHSTKAVAGLLSKAASFSRCIVDPVVLGLADHVLLPNCRAYQLQITTAQEVWAGGKPQPPHRDEEVYGPVLTYGPGAPHYVLGVIVAGTDFTAENGATRIVPGSHLWPSDRVPTPDDFSAAAMPRGSAAIYFGRTIHGAGPNLTDGPRTAFIYGYSVGWLRQEENLFLECPPEFAATLPERAQELLGYQAYSPILGWAADLDSDLLTRPKPADQPWPASMAAASDPSTSWDANW